MVGVGVGVAEPEPDVGDGVGSADELGLAEADFDGVAVAVLDGLAAALVVALAVELLLADALAPALAVALADVLLLALASGVALLLLLALAVVFGVLAAWNAASRVTAVCPAGTLRDALAAAGGEPHTFGAAAVTAASAGLAAPSRQPAMPDDTMAALATAPSAVVADRADFMAVLS